MSRGRKLHFICYSLVLASAANTVWGPTNARAQAPAPASNPAEPVATPAGPPATPLPTPATPQQSAATPLSPPATPLDTAPPASAAPNLPEQIGTGDAWGDDIPGPSAGPFEFHVLLQPRYSHTFAEPSTNPRPGYAVREDLLVRDGDGWSLQRFFFRIGADPEPWVGFKAILDFAKLRGSDVSNVLKQAYARVRPVPSHVEVAAGIFKLPFSILELDPVADYELTDLGDADSFIKDLGFAGRDIGAEVMVAPLDKPKRLRLSAGAFRGHSQDEHASPLGAIGARIETKPWKWLRIGGDVVGMPFATTYKQPFETSGKDILPMPPDPLFPREKRWAAGVAYSADISFATHHWRARLEGMLGDRVDIDTRYGARSFMAAWVLVGYKFRTGPIALMPAARAEWLDADREHAVGGRRELTLGCTVFFTNALQLTIDVTRTDVQPQTAAIEQPLPLPAIPYFDLDNERVTAQLQLRI